ncbi:hypothetical protein GDO86_004583 [Hymenochirus boettgeri]|uniref:Uncharacterized protein n=1 Tax=Hymenochirus boettgeri TaxID=247094 RepID=A0A8T2KBT7_9PIPI|nr:hypothetical protein GDO86_004583 [Hymenochirus boettgeri]
MIFHLHWTRKSYDMIWPHVRANLVTGEYHSDDQATSMSCISLGDGVHVWGEHALVISGNGSLFSQSKYFTFTDILSSTLRLWKEVEQVWELK